jgi:hypothetical protein
VIEGELLDVPFADAVDPAIADMSDPGPFVAQHERCGRGAESAELRVRLADGVDARIGLLKCPAQRRHRPFLNVLGIGERNLADRLGAGLLADSVATHAIGDQEDVSFLEPMIVVHRHLDGERVLVVCAADAHVGQAGVVDLFEQGHRRVLDGFVRGSPSNASTSRE